MYNMLYNIILDIHCHHIYVHMMASVTKYEPEFKRGAHCLGRYIINTMYIYVNMNL